MKTGFSVRHQIAGSGSLIPPDKQYHQQRNHYQYVTLKAGLRRLHGVRHHYAQERYQGLTGWQCPHQGGPTRKQLTEEQKYVDIRARITISNEMGHAIDKNEQGQGLGEHVLMDALVRAYRHFISVYFRHYLINQALSVFPKNPKPSLSAFVGLYFGLFLDSAIPCKATNDGGCRKMGQE